MASFCTDYGTKTVLANTASNNPLYTATASSSSGGQVYQVYIDTVTAAPVKSLYIATSIDNGQTFGPGTLLFSTPATAADFIAAPSIDCNYSGSVIYVLWVYSDSTAPDAGIRIMSNQSNDGGSTWSGADDVIATTYLTWESGPVVKVSGVSGGSRCTCVFVTNGIVRVAETLGLPTWGNFSNLSTGSNSRNARLAIGKDVGHVAHVAWDQGTPSGVFVRTRSTFGNAFAPAITLENNGVDPSRQPRLACSKNGSRAWAIWWTEQAGLNSVSVSGTLDSGATWSVPTVLLSNFVAITPASMSPLIPAGEADYSIAVSGNGNVVSATYATIIGTGTILTRTQIGVAGFEPAVTVASNGLTADDEVAHPQITLSNNGAVVRVAYSGRDSVLGYRVRVTSNFRAGVAGAWSVPDIINFNNPSFPYWPVLGTNDLSNQRVVVFVQVGALVNSVRNAITFCTLQLVNAGIDVLRITDQPDPHFWGQVYSTTYRFTLSSFVSLDATISVFRDRNISLGAISGGYCASINSVSGVNVVSGASILSGTPTQAVSVYPNLTFPGNTGVINLNTTGEPTVIQVTVNWTAKNTGGSQAFSGSWSFDQFDSNNDRWYAIISPINFPRSNISQGISFEDAPCIAEGTFLRLISGDTKPIQDLKRGDLLRGPDGRAVALEALVHIGVPTTNFIKIDGNKFADSLVPHRPLFICSGHPIQLFGQEVMPEEVGEKIVLEKPKAIYTLITGRRDFVEMEGVQVATWSQRGWENFVANDKTGRFLTWEFM